MVRKVTNVHNVPNRSTYWDIYKTEVHITFGFRWPWGGLQTLRHEVYLHMLRIWLDTHCPDAPTKWYHQNYYIMSDTNTVTLYLNWYICALHACVYMCHISSFTYVDIHTDVYIQICFQICSAQKNIFWPIMAWNDFLPWKWLNTIFWPYNWTPPWKSNGRTLT